MRRDVLSIVEAAYDLDVSDPTWLERLTHSIGPFVDRGMGAYGATLDASDMRRVQLGTIHAYRGQEDQLLALRRGHDEHFALLAPNAVQQLYRSGAPIISVTETIGAAGWKRIADGVKGPREVCDCTAVSALDTAGKGYVVIAPSGREQRHPSRVKRMWARLTSHVVAMHRLRGGLSGGRARARKEGEAVLSPGGKVEHAEGPAKYASARSSLREAAIARERARGRLRKSAPDEALEVWNALVAGRWSIVDRFDHDGRRFLVAHENEPEAAGPRALTPRERQVVARVAMGHSNKLVAYELGLTTDAIGRYLATAIRKLGLSSRLEVARLLRAPWLARQASPKGPSRTPK